MLYKNTPEENGHWYCLLELLVNLQNTVAIIRTTCRTLITMHFGHTVYLREE